MKRVASDQWSVISNAGQGNHFNFIGSMRHLQSAGFSGEFAELMGDLLNRKRFIWIDADFIFTPTP